MIRATVATLAALLLAVSLTVVGTPRPAVAATCPGSNTILCEGTVSPTTGALTTATTFTFSVEYVDTQLRAGACATLTITNTTTAVVTGPFFMTPPGGVTPPLNAPELKTGIIFTYPTKLAAGQYTYVFHGDQHVPQGLATNCKKRAFTGGPSITVTNPAPAPTPVPTPSPSATPVIPSDTPSASPSSSDGAVAIVGGPGSSNAPGGSGGAAAGPIVPGSPSGGSGAPLLFLLAASILAAVYLWFLARRRRRRPEPALAPVTTSPFAGPRRPLPDALIVLPKPAKVKRTRAPKANDAVPTSAAAIPAAPSAALFEPSPAEPQPFLAAPLLAAPLEPYGEALMPRWRRPSLRTARYASPRVVPEATPALTFAAAASAGLERRRVRYDLVALTDIPDEIRGAQVGQLQVNDEVEIAGRQGAWVKVRTPLGAEGWIHRTTLRAMDKAPEEVKLGPAPELSAAPPAAVAPDSIEAEAAMGAFAAATAAHDRALEAARVTAAVDEPRVDSKPAKRPRTRRPATPKSAPKT